MICVYAPDNRDFSGNGEAILTPHSCLVRETAGGSYELEMTHPLTADLRWKDVVEDSVIRAPVPARETPGIRLVKDGIPGAPGVPEVPGVPERIIWKVSVTDPQAGGYSRIYERTTSSSAVLQALPNGTEYEYLGQENDEWHRAVSAEGVSGFMFTSNSSYARTEPEIPGTPGVPGEPAMPGYSTVVGPRQVRSQLFRVYETEIDTEGMVLTAHARHISYDFALNLTGRLEVDNLPLALALEQLKHCMLGPEERQLITNIPTAISGEWMYENGVKALMDPESGFVAKARAQLVRDNGDFFLLENQPIDRGVVVSYGKNLKGVRWGVSCEQVATRIVPIGQDKEGEPLLLPEIFVDSPYLDQYPLPRMKRLEVSDARETEEMDLDAVYARMRDAAQEALDEGADLRDLSLDVDFVNLGDSEEYMQYRGLQQVHLYDTITIRHAPLGFNTKAQVKGYVWDAVLQRYDGIEVGDVFAMNAQGIASYELPGWGIGGNKLAPSAVGSRHLRHLSVLSAHINAASIDMGHLKKALVEELKAQSVQAIRGLFRQLVSEEITTDQLWADVAYIVSIYLRTADIGWAQIKDLVTDTAIITQGVGGEMYFAKLAVTEGNMLSLTVGQMVVKGADGRFYAIVPDGQGGVTTQLKQVVGDDVADRTLDAGEKLIEGSVTAAELNAENIFGDSALIRELMAAHIDTDTLFSREAFISQLNAFDIRGNTHLQLALKEVEGLKTTGILITTNKIKVTGAEVDFDTQLFKIRDGDNPILTAEGGEVAVGADVFSAQKYHGPIVQTHPGGTLEWKGSFYATVRNIPKYLEAAATINVPAGTYNEEVIVRGFKGSLLRINLAAGVTINGRIIVEYCDRVEIYGASDMTSIINVSPGAETGVSAMAVKLLWLRCLRVTGRVRGNASDSTNFGIFLQGTDGWVRDCIVERMNYAICAYDTSMLTCSDNSGGVSGGDYTTLANLIQGVRADRGSHIGMYGTTPMAPATSFAGASTIVGTGTPTGSPGAAPAPPSTVVRNYTQSAAAGWVVQDPAHFGGFTTSRKPQQGVSNGFHFAGLWMLPVITNASTATVAKLTITRSSDSGSVNPVLVKLLYVTSDWTSLSGQTFDANGVNALFAAAGHEVSLARGESVTIELNSTVLSLLKNGTIKGFGLSNYYTPWVVMEPDIALEVTTSN